MGSLPTTNIDYENLRNARILENQTRLASLGLQKTISDLRSLVSSAKSEKTQKRKYCRVEYGASSLRRSNRLNGITINHISLRISRKPTTKIDYENLRNARILENQTRLASLGLQKTISDLRSLVSSAKSEKTQKRKYCKVEYGASSLHRSNRLKGITINHISLRRSDRLRGKCGNLTLVPQGKGVFEDKQESLLHGEEEKRPKNTPLVKIEVSNLQLSPDALAQRCNSKGRGSVYHSTFGICCHFCRQKKLCGEEDCKRCGNLDMDQPCIGKTDCSVCHSSNGILCRACLKVRYGQDLDEVRENKEWMCPHCIEDKGMNPYWICNSSLCLQKRKMAPTGIAIFRARKMGYKSVAHLLMDELQQKENRRRR